MIESIERNTQLKTNSHRDLISIVIPVFNVEKYLKRCLDSLLSQTYSNIEIILTNNGSTDASGIICEEYKNKDSRVKVIHQDNGGPSEARNAGIDIANGKYIAFVDSDDWVSRFYVENLYNALVKTNADISVSKFELVRGDNAPATSPSGIPLHLECISGAECLQRILLQKGMETSAPGRLYKLKAVDKVRFPEGKIYEDIMFSAIIVSNANRIAVIDNVDYYYFQRTGSISNQTFSSARMDCINNSRMLVDYVSENYPEYFKDVICWYFSGLCSTFLKIPKDSYKAERELIWKEIKRYRWAVLSNKHARTKNKFAALVSYLGPQLLRDIYKTTQIRGNLLSEQ